MQISQENLGKAVVVAVTGRIDSRTSQEFENKLLGVFEEGATNVIIDFSNVDFLSSAGLRVLLLGAKRANSNHGKLMCCSMSENIRDVFDKCGMGTIIRAFSSRQDCLTGLS